MPEPRGNADTEPRDHLLAAAVDFRQLMSSTLESHTIEGGQTVWEHLSGRVDALLEGREVTFARYELPDWHPLAPCHGGNPSDSFTLGTGRRVTRVDVDRASFRATEQSHTAGGWLARNQRVARARVRLMLCCHREAAQ